MNESTPELQSTQAPISDSASVTPETQPFWKEKRVIVLGSIVGVVLLILIVGNLFTRRTPPNTADVSSIVSEAQAANKKGDYALAIADAKKGLALDPTNKSLLLAIITAYATKNQVSGQPHANFNDALSYIKQAQKLYPKDSAVLTAIGFAYESDGQYDMARDAYDKALAADPNSASVLFHIGHLSEAEGKQQDAFTYYNKAYTLDNSDPLILMGKAREAVLTGNPTGALTFYKDITNESGNSGQILAEAYGAQAQILQQQLVYGTDAIATAKKGVDADPSYAPVVATYGYNVGLYGHPKDGADELDKAIALDPSLSGAYWQKGIIDRISKRYQSAVSDFTGAIQHVDADATLLGTTNKNNAKGQYYYDLAKTYSIANAGKITDVTDNLQKAISYNPKVVSFIKSDMQTAGVFTNVSQDALFKRLIQ